MKNILALIKSFGPGFIMAAVVLDPGNVTVASKIGRANESRMLWAKVIAGIPMTAYTKRVHILGQ